MSGIEDGRCAAEALSAVVRDLPDGMVWRYEISIRGGRLTHTWAITSDRGGIHVNAWRSSTFGRDEWLGGIEGHSPTPMYDYGSDKPSHEHCWLIGKPCWHDGSSLQFSEQIAPTLPFQGEKMTESNHAYILRVMLSRHESWLPASGIEAATADETALAASSETTARAGTASPNLSDVDPLSSRQSKEPRHAE